MSTEQLLVLVIALLTVNLLFVGIYIVLVLKEVKEGVHRMNDILENINQVSAAISKPIVGASGAISAFTAGLKAYSKLKKKREEKAEES